MGLISFFQKRNLKKAQASNQRQKVMKNLMEMKSLLVLCSVNSMEEWEKWQRYFENRIYNFSKIQLVVFIQDKNLKEKPKSISADLFIPMEVSWTGMPKDKQSIKKYISDHYDLVIDLNFDDIFVLNWILVNSAATLKVGAGIRNEVHEFYDLIIKTETANKQPKLYIDQVFYFLQQINENGHK
ncbi:MAG: hypothetical protein GQ527_08950 [Bacteroidales bacterium]|nr:hypothetical protein [Bacteroidales bacterium]